MMTRIDPTQEQLDYRARLVAQRAPADGRIIALSLAIAAAAVAAGWLLGRIT